MNETSPPLLQPPDAGLPWWKLLAARYVIFPGACRKLDWAAAAAATEQPIPRGEGLRAPHPWLDPIDAFQWHRLLGFHPRIHRQQIEAILATLRPR